MRLAHKTPVKCSSCFGQYPDRPHVDFESAYDGPQIDPENPRRGHIDWLVICSDCIQAAAGFLPEERDALEQLRQENESVKQALAEADNYIDQLESAHSARPASRGPKSTTQRAPKKRRYEPEVAQ